MVQKVCKIEIELNLFNYAAKSDLKNATGVDTSHFAEKDDLVNLKSEIDKFDIDKFKTCTKQSRQFEKQST